MRCRPRLTAPGDSTWITRSTAPMSMPSSRLLVATMARRSPRLSWSSTTIRCSRASEPWCALTRSSRRLPVSGSTPMPRSSASSLSLAASRSASRRALQKMIVERCSSTWSRMRGYTLGQIEELREEPVPAYPPAAGSSVGDVGAPTERSPMSSTGMITWTSSGLPMPASTIVTGRGWFGRGVAAEEPSHFLERALRCRQADALRRALGQLLEAFQRQAR